MNSQKVRKKETVQRILDAAGTIFAEVGFGGARVDEIAARADVNKAMIYYHIGDKQALYTRVLHTVFGDAASRMTDNLAQVDTPQDKIKAYIHSIAETLEKHPHLPPIMMREMAAGGVNLPEIVAQDLAAILGMITELLKEGREQGEFVEVNPLALHLMVVGGFSFFKTSGPTRNKYLQLMDQSVEVFDNSALKLEKEIKKIVLRAVKR